jgi:hypothetical protein
MTGRAKIILFKLIMKYALTHMMEIKIEREINMEGNKLN